MAKIIILGDGKDADAAKAALEGASIECEIVKPSAANLLHIVIGMVDDEPEEKEEPKDENAEEAPAEEPKSKEAPAEEPVEEPVEESLGETSVDGEVLNAVRGKNAFSTLFVSSLTAGARTTYAVNEDSSVSFWPADVANPAQRMLIEHQKHRASVEVRIAESKTGKSYLEVGTDLVDIFTAK